MVDAFVSQKLTAKVTTNRLLTTSRLLATISKEDLKEQLTEYLEKRKEANADELAAQYVNYIFVFWGSFSFGPGFIRIWFVATLLTFDDCLNGLTCLANREKGKVIGGTKGNKILEYVSGAPNKEQVIDQAPNVFDYDELTKYGYGVRNHPKFVILAKLMPPIFPQQSHHVSPLPPTSCET